MNLNTIFTLGEYKNLFVAETFCEKDGNIGIPKKDFDALETNILTHEKNVAQFFRPTYKKNFGKCLEARNFVGILRFRNGVTIEILPKIVGADREETRKTFLKMLSRLRNSPFFDFDEASLKNIKMPILEFFISLFCHETEKIIKTGLRRAYVQKTENQNFLKGKLDFKNHIRQNFIHRERFFVNFDEFSENLPENKIIKTALQFLYSISCNSKNMKRLRESLFIFDEVSFSRDFDSDFQSICRDRDFSRYEKILSWCRIFLKKEGISTFCGGTVSFSLLFDMNRVFEDFVADFFRKSGRKVAAQKSGKYLVELPKKRFALRPDLILDDSEITDTKWKMIDSEASDGKIGISQSDLYQMFAYGKKFQKKELMLIYPKSEKFLKSVPEKFSFGDEELQIVCFDCERGEIL